MNLKSLLIKLNQSSYLYQDLVDFYEEIQDAKSRSSKQLVLTGYRGLIEKTLRITLFEVLLLKGYQEQCKDLRISSLIKMWIVDLNLYKSSSEIGILEAYNNELRLTHSYAEETLDNFCVIIASWCLYQVRCFKFFGDKYSIRPIDQKFRGGIMMSGDKKYLLSPQEDGTYVRVLEDGRKEILIQQQVLEMIYEMDPLIKKTAEKLFRLSQDPDVVLQYEEHEEKHLDEVWDEIDKIADQHGGHYVVPTIPGSIDTTDVSEFIKKQKEQREFEKRGS
ncbi:hypothetical protein A8990_114101 [Paenibacillus taihuensis]|uniref:Uncharacterized protein n=1 Tax=Paenibacillus taihuensis TaxID=1156355 RepID=A0A3D9S5J6_9BACL|nr:hypothetical protein [Paenibacillus taihuensis]REE84566.1 hypothetical protein A8990_114101 [Paenibacillus taihuensis]